MTRTRPDLMVPIRDRRQHRRILTLKNFRNALFVLIALFAGLTIYANLRDRHPRADFGRLYGGRVEAPAPPVAKQPEAVQEEPIRDETAADPTLVQAAARSQILLDERAAQPVPPVPTREAAVVHDNTSAVAIVGGPDGVTIVKRDPRRPVLGGGFGRQ